MTAKKHKPSKLQPRSWDHIEAKLPKELITDTPQMDAVIRGINWKLLRKQKQELIYVALPHGSADAEPELMGIVHLLDALQDAAVSDGIADERAVFGKR
jgi:hypothetical protein